MGTTVPIEITCWACGKSSMQDVIVMASQLGEPDLDGRPHRTIQARYLVQECPHCGYCANDLSVPAPGAEGVITSEAYRAQLHHPGYPKTANRFLCWGMLREAVGTEQDPLAFVLSAAWACEEERNGEKAGELRLRAARLMMARGPRTGQEAGVDDIIIADLFRRAGAFDDAIKQCDTGLAKDVQPRIRDRLTLERDLARWRDTGPHSPYEGSDPGPRPERGPRPCLGDRLRLNQWESLSKLWQELQARRAAEGAAASPPASVTPSDDDRIRGGFE